MTDDKRMQELKAEGQTEQSSQEYATLVQTLKAFQYIQQLRMQHLAAAQGMCFWSLCADPKRVQSRMGLRHHHSRVRAPLHLPRVRTRHLPQWQTSLPNK